MNSSTTRKHLTEQINLLWDIMNKRGYPKYLIETIKKCLLSYKDTGDHLSENIPINQGVRQDYNGSPTLFNINIYR